MLKRVGLFLSKHFSLKLRDKKIQDRIDVARRLIYLSIIYNRLTLKSEGYARKKDDQYVKVMIE